MRSDQRSQTSPQPCSYLRADGSGQREASSALTSAQAQPRSRLAGRGQPMERSRVERGKRKKRLDRDEPAKLYLYLAHRLDHSQPCAVDFAWLEKPSWCFPVACQQKKSRARMRANFFLQNTKIALQICMYNPECGGAQLI